MMAERKRDGFDVDLWIFCEHGQEGANVITNVTARLLSLFMMGHLRQLLFDDMKCIMAPK
jgi:hypothetical protein